MKIISFKKNRPSILKAVAKMLKRGAVIVYPTDTAYALGCDATNRRAVARIFRIKGRPSSKGFPVICADLKMVKEFFRLSFPRTRLACPAGRESNHHGPDDRHGLDPRLRGGDEKTFLLLKKHWPGPLSIVIKAKKAIVRAAMEKGTAAVRVPDSAIARKIAAALGRPLVATSANLSGAPTAYSIKSVLRQWPCAKYGYASENGCPKGMRIDMASQRNMDALSARPDLLIDAGALPRRKPSTIVRLGKRGKMEILRRGPVRI